MSQESAFSKPSPSSIAGVARIAFVCSIAISMLRRIVEKRPADSRRLNNINDITTTVKHVAVSSVPDSHSPTDTRHIIMLVALEITICRTEKRSALNSSLSAWTRQSSTALAYFPSASSIRENALTTLMPRTYSRTELIKVVFAAT